MKEPIIEIRDVAMEFNMSTVKIDSLKEYAVRLLKGELMFKSFLALDGVSIDIHKGDVVGFVGLNGSGKSTLLKVVSGVLKPSRGSVTVRGNISPLIELGAGFDADLTARENIFLNGAILGYSKAFMESVFDEIVDFAELWNFLDVPTKNFSSGMQARLGFAIATVVKPDILIVDEVLAVGDFKFQQKCERRIQELMAGDTTVLIVSHSTEQIRRLCNRVLWIDHGKEVMCGPTQEVCDAYLANA